MDDRPRWVRRKCNCECGCNIHKYTKTSPWTCPICLAHNLSWEPPSDRLCTSNILVQTNPSDIPDSCIIHLDIEQGDCTLVRLNRINILIDAGYKDRGRAAARRLKLFGIREINHVILTHSDKDHYGGLTHDNIIAMFTPKTTFYCTYRNEGFLRRKIDKAHPLRRIPTDSFGLLINADGDNTACIHHCPTFIDQESAGTNDTSPLLMVQIGQFGCIIAGDLTITCAAADGLRAFASPQINIQHIGMLLPHHGSYYAFEEGALAKVCSIWPKKVYGVISCSALVHGHPHEELVAEATSLGMKLYITNLFAYREDAAAMHLIRIGGTIDFYGDLLVLPNNRYEDTLMQMFACAGDAPGAVNENPYDLTPLVDYRRAIGPHTRPRGRVATVNPLILKRERSTTLSVSSGLDQHSQRHLLWNQLKTHFWPVKSF